MGNIELRASIALSTPEIRKVTAACKPLRLPLPQTSETSVFNKMGAFSKRRAEPLPLRSQGAGVLRYSARQHTSSRNLPSQP
jgi:hypothetical protein